MAYYVPSMLERTREPQETCRRLVASWCRRYLLDCVSAALRERPSLFEEEGAFLPRRCMAASAWHNEGTAARSLLPTCPVGLFLHVTCATSRIFCSPYRSCDLSSVSILPNIVSMAWTLQKAVRNTAFLCVELYIYDSHYILHCLCCPGFTLATENISAKPKVFNVLYI